MKSPKLQSTNIDAVITWVNGDDPNLKIKRRRTLEKHGDFVSEESIQSRGSNNEVELNRTESANNIPTALSSTRFVDNNEIYFCIQSILKYAPWIRRIHVVTDNQKPEFLTPVFCRANNINIVDHKDIFRGYEWALPTFNTRTIESALWRIPGLAPRFISFNDDFMLIASVTPEDFFSGDSVILRGKYNRMKKYGRRQMAVSNYITKKAQEWFGITRTMHLLQQMLSAKLAGFEKKYFRVQHIPQPVYKKTLEHFFKEHPDKFKDNIRYRLRNTNQFSAIFLAHHLQIKSSKAVLLSDSSLLEFNGELDSKIGMRLKSKRLPEGNKKFACFNSMEKYAAKERELLLEQMKKCIAG